MLLAAQAVAVALGALPVFWLARKHLGSERLAVLFSLAYLLYAPVQWLALDEFHAVALACPLLLYAVWYLDEGRLPAALPVPRPAAALTRRKCRSSSRGSASGLRSPVAGESPAAAIAVAGIEAVGAVSTVVMPYFRDGDSPAFYDRYDAVGGSPIGIVKTAFTDPTVLLEAVTQAETSPISSSSRSHRGLFLGAPLLVLAAVPGSQRTSSPKPNRRRSSSTTRPRSPRSSSPARCSEQPGFPDSRSSFQSLRSSAPSRSARFGPASSSPIGGQRTTASRLEPSTSFRATRRSAARTVSAPTRPGGESSASRSSARPTGSRSTCDASYLDRRSAPSTAAVPCAPARQRRLVDRARGGRHLRPQKGRGQHGKQHDQERITQRDEPDDAPSAKSSR